MHRCSRSASTELQGGVQKSLRDADMRIYQSMQLDEVEMPSMLMDRHVNFQVLTLGDFWIEAAAVRR